METVLGVLSLFGLAGLLVGVVLCLSPSKRQTGKTIATYGAAAFVFAFGYALIAAPKHPDSTKQSTAPDRVAQNASASQGPDGRSSEPSQRVSRSDALKNFRIGGFRWSKDGFGSVMIATFVIYNDNGFPVKDVEVTCTHTTKTDTVIDRNTRTVYEPIAARSYHSVVDANMGFIHSAATSSNCRVTNFARV